MKKNRLDEINTNKKRSKTFGIQVFIKPSGI